MDSPASRSTGIQNLSHDPSEFPRVSYGGKHYLRETPFALTCGGTTHVLNRAPNTVIDRQTFRL
jgi:hypothetical protein